MLLLMLGSAGCTGQSLGTHYTVHLDPAFSPEYRSVALESLSDWATMTDGAITFDVVDDYVARAGEGEIVVHPSTIAAILAADGASPLGGHFAAYTMEHPSCDCATVSIATDYSSDPRELGRVMRHELGHALGLGHDIAGTVMYPKVEGGGARVVTCRDAARVVSDRGGTMECK